MTYPACKTRMWFYYLLPMTAIDIGAASSDHISRHLDLPADFNGRGNLQFLLKV